MRAAARFVEDVTLEALEDDPYPIYARLRSEAPATFVPAADVWFVTRFSDCERVGTGQDGFVGARNHPTLERVFGSPNVLTAEGEEHGDLRAGIDPRLQPQPILESVGKLVRPLARGYLERLAALGEGELMADYFEPVSVEALRRVMGLDDLVDADTLRRWFHDLNAGVSNFGLTQAGFAVADAASADIERIVIPKLDYLSAHPDDSMLSHMLWAGRERAQGPRSYDFIMPSLKVILLGGMQEPGHAAASTLVGLLSRPDQWAKLLGNPGEYLPLAVNEGLRWVAPIGAVERQATRDVVLHGQTIPAGAMVEVILASANRDESRFSDPDLFDMERSSRTHQAFGNGVHFCAGHFFAREVEKIMLGELIAALPGLWLKPEALPRFTGWVFRAPKELPVIWDPAIQQMQSLAVQRVLQPTDPSAAPHAEATRVLEVRALRKEADAVISIELAAADGAPLPPWEPGAHIDLWVTPERAGQYSLCGDPERSNVWKVAVQRAAESRGSSRFVHEEMRVGTRLHVGGPRNNFTLQSASRYLFVAGGIGITPVLPMVRAAMSKGLPAKLVYCGRSRSRMAFLSDVLTLGIDVSVYARDEGPRADLSALVSGAAQTETMIYGCGPADMLAELEAAAALTGAALAVERFDTSIAHRDDDFDFEVLLHRTGRKVIVPAGTSILDALDAQGVHVRRACQAGNCGSCETMILAGEADHRDVLLTAGQRATQARLLICVSRAKDRDRPLVLDL